MESEKKNGLMPNFFIIGAPKSGTTSLYRYLSEHPDIVMSEPKEPHFFAHDLPAEYRHVLTMKEYRETFSHDNPGQNLEAVGEASVDYLLSDVAVSNIREFNPSSKIIVLLRNPIELVHSLHAQALYSGNENIPDFRAAWEAQEDRKKGKNIPKDCTNPNHLQYRKMGCLGSHMERVYEIFPDEQVLPIVFDDFKEDTKEVYEEILSFLDVTSDEREQFPVENPNQKHRFRSVGRVVQNPPSYAVRFAMKAKEMAGLQKLGILGRLREWNTMEQERDEMPGEFRDKLVEEFEPEIDRLEEVIGRSLDDWRA